MSAGPFAFVGARCFQDACHILSGMPGSSDSTDKNDHAEHQNGKPFSDCARYRHNRHNRHNPSWPDWLENVCQMSVVSEPGGRNQLETEHRLASRSYLCGYIDSM